MYNDKKFKFCKILNWVKLGSGCLNMAEALPNLSLGRKTHPKH